MPADRATARTRAPVPAAKAAKAPAKRETAPVKRAAGATGPPVLRLVPPGARREEGVDELLRSPGPGAPLPDAIRRRLESTLRVDLSSVRVYNDDRAAGVADRLRARAFTFGRRIFLGSRELVTDLPLIAHEAAHVVQQRGRPVVQMSTGAPSPAALEREADSASAAVQQQGPIAVTGRTGGPAIQRQERLGTIDQGPLKEEEEGWLEAQAWAALGAAGRELREIKRKGIVGWLLEHIKSGMQTLVDRLLEPLRPLMTAIAWVRAQFAAALDSMREAAVQIAKNDCSAITKAVERIQEIANVILTAVKDKLDAATAKVKDFFGRLWEKFGAPVWETLKEIGGAVWERIQQLGAWMWEKTEPIRKLGASAWTWFKNEIGIGEGEEGQNGLLQWVQQKAGEAWDWLKPKIEPFKKPLLVAAGIAVMFSPAGPFVAAAAGIAAWTKAIQWIRQNMSSKNAVVDQRSVLQRTVLPAVMKVSDQLGATLKAVAGDLGKSLGGIAASLGATVGELAGSAVAFLTRAIEWIQVQVQALVTWAQEQFAILSERVSDGLTRLKAFMQPVLDFLAQVAGVYRDIYSLPGLIIGKLWRKIPACVRDPFVNFLIEQVLKRIPLFKTVTETIPAIWNKIKATAMAVIQKIFKEGDLKGAALEVLKLVLEALEVPIELFTGIFSKTPALLDKIMEDPGKFLGNVLSALKEGILGFGKRILENLLGGLTSWLLGQLKDANVKPPENLSLKAVFLFVLDIIGLNFEMVVGRLEKKNKPAADALRKVAKVATEVWSWISTLLNEGPEGVWKRLGEKISDLWGALVASASTWIMTQVATKALVKIAALAAAPVGTIISGLVLIYDTIRAIARYLRQMLEIINGVLDMGLDLASGAIQGAAKLVEGLLQKALGLALGFLAQYAGAGDLGKKIAEIIQTIRDKVTEAVDWLLDKAIAAMKGVVGLVKTGVGKLLEWWKRKEPFNDGKGSHTVGFKGEGAKAELVIESTPQPVENYLKATKMTDQVKLNQIGVHVATIKEIKTRTAAGFGQKDGELIRLELVAIADLLGKKTAESDIKFKAGPRGKFKGPVATVMTAKILSLRSSTYAGSAPYDESDFWLEVNKREGSYVRGHMLNHHVHGPGMNDNLVPLPNSTNTRMETKFEHHVKKRVLGNADTVSYTVEAVYDRKPGRIVEAEDLMPSSLKLYAEVLDPKTGKSKAKPEELLDDELTVDLPSDTAIGFKRSHVVLTEATPEEIATAGIPHVKIGLATRIAEYALSNKDKLRYFSDLRNVPQMPGELVTELEKDPENRRYVTLYKQT